MSSSRRSGCAVFYLLQSLSWPSHVTSPAFYHHPSMGALAPWCYPLVVYARWIHVIFSTPSPGYFVSYRKKNLVVAALRWSPYLCTLTRLRWYFRPPEQAPLAMFMLAPSVSLSGKPFPPRWSTVDLEYFVVPRRATACFASPVRRSSPSHFVCVSSCIFPVAASLNSTRQGALCRRLCSSWRCSLSA